MSQLDITEWVPKFVAALREAQAAGVTQISSRLGTPDGCRCAEGVIGDLLVAEGLMEVNNPYDLYLEYRAVGDSIWSNGGLGMAFTTLFNEQLRVRVVPSDPTGVTVWYLNDVYKKPFGEIADLMEAGWLEGWYSK